MGHGMGVFIGFATVFEWPSVQRDAASVATAWSNLGGDAAAAAGRVSFLLGLKGPCFSVNTACSSSLVALDSACQALRLSKCASAMVAGVNLQLHPSGWAGFCAMHALSDDGQCKTFDASADGYGRGEACGAVQLEQRRKEDGAADSMTMLAALQGTAVNQDGKSASFMAPNGPSQEAVIRSAMLEAGVMAGSCGVSYVEAHGTGTALGDPMELGALRRVLSASTSDCCLVVTFNAG